MDVVAHLDGLWRYARVLTRDDAAAEELVQEALSRALALARTFDLSRPLLPWLIAIVRNTYLTNISREKAEQRRIQSLGAISNAASLPAQEYSTDLAQVQRAMETLPTEQAEVLHLVGVVGFSYADAADVLGIPQGTVMSRLSRARSALRQALEPKNSRTGLRVVGGRNDI
ncbi:MAG: sigma-70 family RNA polymerase sigma factor [Rhizobiaceae bacterium]